MRAVGVYLSLYCWWKLRINIRLQETLTSNCLLRICQEWSREMFVKLRSEQTIPTTLPFWRFFEFLKPVFISWKLCDWYFHRPFSMLLDMKSNIFQTIITIIHANFWHKYKLQLKTTKSLFDFKWFKTLCMFVSGDNRAAFHNSFETHTRLT